MCGIYLCRYVQVAIPTPFDKTAHNGLEQYTWDEKNKRVAVQYTFKEGSFNGKEVVVKQKGRVNPKSTNGAMWQVNEHMTDNYKTICADIVAYAILTGMKYAIKIEKQLLENLHDLKPITTDDQVKPWLGLFYLPIWLDYYILDIDTTNDKHIVASSPGTCVCVRACA